FEIGTVFKTGKGAPVESASAAGVLTGARRARHWSEGDAKVPDMDVWDLKHHFELAVQVAAPGATVQALSSGAGWEAVAGGQVVGWAGPLDADAPRWAGAAFGFEGRVSEVAPGRPRFRLLPGTAPGGEDLALGVAGGLGGAGVGAGVGRRAG